MAHSIVSSNDAAAANANERKLIRLGCGFGLEDICSWQPMQNMSIGPLMAAD